MPTSTVKLTSRIPTITREMVTKAEEIKRASAIRIASDMRATHAWKDVSGEERGSIEADGGEVRADFPWRQLEFGTVTAPARPFVIPAAEAEFPRFMSAMKGIVS